jgi:hypothetical protein
MTVRPGLRGFAALALIAGFCGGAAAQGKLSLSPDESNRFAEIRNGTKLYVKENNAGEAQKNADAIKRKAQVEVALMLDAYNVNQGSSDGAKSIAMTVHRLNDIIIDPLIFPKPLKEGQRDMIKIFGEEMVSLLKPLAGTAEKPSGADIVVKLNAARQLSILAKSGYVGAAEYATDILNDPNQHDAIKVYALQSLKNFFAVPHPEMEGKSVYGNNVAAEAKPIQAIIKFLSRKSNLPADAKDDEIDAFRYLRREATAALGQVRKPIVRDPDGKVIAVPAIWLLRVANGDVSFNPSVSMSERIEALAGYLNLLGDKEENMDFASWYVNTAVLDLTKQYKEARIPEKIKADDKKLPDKPYEERDRVMWRLSANRFQVGLRVWRDNYQNPAFGPRPANIITLMNDLATKIDNNVLNAMITGTRRDDINTTPLEDWKKNNQFPNRMLVNDDPSTVVTRPDDGR